MICLKALRRASVDIFGAQRPQDATTGGVGGSGGAGGRRNTYGLPVPGGSARRGTYGLHSAVREGGDAGA